MTTQIHMAGRIWTSVRRQLMNRVLQPLEQHGQPADQQGQRRQPAAALAEGEHGGLDRVVVAVADGLHQAAEQDTDLLPAGGRPSSAPGRSASPGSVRPVLRHGRPHPAAPPDPAVGTSRRGRTPASRGHRRRRRTRRPPVQASTPSGRRHVGRDDLRGCPSGPGYPTGPATPATTGHGRRPGRPRAGRPAAGLAHCPAWLPSTSSPCATCVASTRRTARS